MSEKKLYFLTNGGFMKIIQQVQAHIESIPLGEPFTTKAFLSYGARAAIDQALSRLVKQGKIKRITRGVFIRPKENRFVGEIAPEPYKIAKAIAQKNNFMIQMHGAEAIRKFGLSTQVPMQPIFYTNGPSKQLHLGKLKITLKHTTPRKFALANRPAGMALSALWYLGKNEVTLHTIESIRKKLPVEEFKALKEAIPSMPAWMANVIYRYEKHRHHDY